MLSGLVTKVLTRIIHREAFHYTHSLRCCIGYSRYICSGRHLCGEGTVHTLLLGAWNWQAVHLTMNRDTGTKPDAQSLWSLLAKNGDIVGTTGTKPDVQSLWSARFIRILKSNFSDPDDFKTIKMAVLARNSA